MKKFIETLLILFIVCSCETNFDIEASEKEIPVVYGVLNVNDIIQAVELF